MKNILKQFVEEMKNEQKILHDIEKTQKKCEDKLSYEILEMHRERMMQKINASQSVIDRLSFYIHEKDIAKKNRKKSN